ncbi:hypothetical protein PL321_18935 [Caloramator sp. mosi_1]|nr:hypothetical protein [Caloramator sp. mosi_1]WDC85920.1 hypothetical protein PL321_18935 [Caloramator sp. mosi_1]
MESLKIAKEQDAKTVIITNKNNTHFEQMFDLVIYVNSTDGINRLITTTSRLTILFIIDLIFYSCLDNDYENINKILNNNSII